MTDDGRTHKYGPVLAVILMTAVTVVLAMTVFVLIATTPANENPPEAETAPTCPNGDEAMRGHYTNDRQPWTEGWVCPETTQTPNTHGD